MQQVKKTSLDVTTFILIYAMLCSRSVLTFEAFYSLFAEVYSVLLLLFAIFAINRPLTNWTKPLFKSEAKCKAIDMKGIFFILLQIKLIFTRKVLHLASF